MKKSRVDTGGPETTLESVAKSLLAFAAALAESLGEQQADDITRFLCEMADDPVTDAATSDLL